MQPDYNSFFTKNTLSLLLLVLHVLLVQIHVAHPFLLQIHSLKLHICDACACYISEASARLDSKVEATPCANSPCRNEGICKPLSGGSFICECPLNATGPLCESSALPLYKTPAFSGTSFLQIKKMKAYNKVQVRTARKII